MTRKVKFALEMADGTKVRISIEELRQHFDMQSVASYYLSGKLFEWLEDRYYDDEAAKIEELDKDAPNLNAQLCAIIGVDASKFDALDVEAVERLNEKKSILRQKTSDSTIIDNAMITALTQEDLADLLDLESPIIYLCGDKFNIPIRVEHKKYVGVLGTPKIEIRATSDDDLKAKDIIFENVILPWNKLASVNNNLNNAISQTNQQVDTIVYPSTEKVPVKKSVIAKRRLVKAENFICDTIFDASVESGTLVKKNQRIGCLMEGRELDNELVTIDAPRTGKLVWIILDGDEVPGDFNTKELVFGVVGDESDDDDDMEEWAQSKA